MAKHKANKAVKRWRKVRQQRRFDRLSGVSGSSNNKKRITPLNAKERKKLPGFVGYTTCSYCGKEMVYVVEGLFFDYLDNHREPGTRKLCKGSNEKPY